MEARTAPEPKTTEENLLYCISEYKFTFLISLAFSRQPHRPIQMSRAMTQLFINMYADNQPEKIIERGSLVTASPGEPGKVHIMNPPPSPLISLLLLPRPSGPSGVADSY